MATISPMKGLDWIAVDWGTTTLRVWAVAPDGAILASASSEEGMGTLTTDGYEPALIRLVGAWLADATARPVPVIVCGMAGARQGWKEAAYRTVPCSPVANGQLTRVATHDRRLDVSIVPGLCQREPADVMRGEETQLAGLVARIGPEDVTVCMPGTHSKWVQLTTSGISRFTTAMTGELFSIIARHSILRHSVETADANRQAFLGGVREMLAHPRLLTSSLFSIRATNLLAGMEPASARSRLSGLLVGAELAATRESWDGRTVHLVGVGPLAEMYAEALADAGAVPIVEDAQALTLAGLAIARAALLEASP